MAGLVIGLSPVKVEVRFRGSEKLSISELLIRINELAEEIGSKVVIAIDEAWALEGLLNNLMGMGIIEKVDDEYRIADPVYRLAAEHL